MKFEYLDKIDNECMMIGYSFDVNNVCVKDVFNMYMEYYGESENFYNEKVVIKNDKMIIICNVNEDSIFYRFIVSEDEILIENNC